MKKCLLSLIALTGLVAGGPVRASDCCDEPVGWHQRCLNQFHDCLDCLTGGYGKTHHDFGCTGCRAAKTFIFGSCCEFFEEPCYCPRPPAKCHRSLYK